LGIIPGLFPLVIIKGLVLLVSVFPGACWEPVPTGLFCIVVLLASRYFPASLNFLIYILLTFDQKKKVIYNRIEELLLEDCSQKGGTSDTFSDWIVGDISNATPKVASIAPPPSDLDVNVISPVPTIVGPQAPTASNPHETGDSL